MKYMDEPNVQFQLEIYGLSLKMQKNQMLLDESVKMDSKDDRIKMDDWGNTLIFS